MEKLKLSNLTWIMPMDKSSKGDFRNVKNKRIFNFFFNFEYGSLKTWLPSPNDCIISTEYITSIMKKQRFSFKIIAKINKVYQKFCYCTI
ncbi:hypothetical protein BpHYR1_005203 [Brachionus plicatilis]|uniref:Uncharacterized protein n=1 Tax=Brachionus plicatilis TaxID=10195 RepID=A0A3M7PBG4_BRAPC|nr:hypothetical protein BpHYR1_005203 [Brachionus plicatilis]